MPDLTDEQLAELLARDLMGWKIGPVNFRMKDGKWCGYYIDELLMVWNPLENIDHAWIVQAAIEQRGLQRQFCTALIIGIEAWATADHAKSDWHLINASPRQRCEAAARAIGTD